MAPFLSALERALDNGALVQVLLFDPDSEAAAQRAQDLKRAVDARATGAGVSGPELARRLIAEGLARMEEEEVWERTARIAPLVRDRDEKIVQRMDRLADSWEPTGRRR